MNPSFAIVLFTTLAGSAQGLSVALAFAALAGVAPAPGVLLLALGVAQALLLVALASAFAHLGRPERAWRAAAMWRTSWMSREVIVLPAFMAAVAGWALAVWCQAPAGAQALLAAGVLALAALLWLCTGMIYACLRMVREWAHPLTVLNYALMGLCSGAVLAGALAAAAGEGAFARRLQPWALALTLLAWAGRALALRRNAALVPRSTPQSATGLRGVRVVQLSRGFTGGSHNTREFFHGASPWAVRQVKPLFLMLAFKLPALLLALPWIGVWDSTWIWGLAVLLQTLGLLAERWFFFAHVRHPQNLYYQAVA
ncbi:dimethyl sulfoxide reductase anchor subunit family protein [Azohydromonas caseinilytica]|uniref:Dimethyl sulfoxide reductase anchor subunit n=1 Tax=Azohydromonas caseinilytica TaxID=2728836 RepID=A0A848FHA1_9BURK|nr:DmsC/YnfH family molybdoenzyme membrane anchor subunit [Azohydromonas caseinilytica]NML17633.1 dimethyl sulfoxide reductase anchor subunit [Azohydromonas caseinilytica]